MAIVLSEEQKADIEEIVEKFNLGQKWIEQGEIKGEIKSLIKILNKKFGELPENLTKQIYSVKDKEIIETIMDNIFEISSIEEVEKYLQ